MEEVTGEEQIRIVVLGWAIWIGLVTATAIVCSFFSRRWQQKFWLPGIGKLRGAISWLGWRLVDRAERDRLIEREIKARAAKKAEAGPLKGRRTGLHGVTNYGPINTRTDTYDSSLRAEWKNNKQVFGRLVPSTGGTWEVQYGHYQGSVRPQFAGEETLGRAATVEEGVDRLRVRDLNELDTQQAELQLDAATLRADGDQ